MGDVCLSGLGGVLPLAYIGPGAGFAFLGSFLILLAAIGLAALAIISWPFRLVLGWILRPTRKRAKTTIRRVVVLGLDGLDPRRCRRLMDAGSLPNLKRLADAGTFSPLRSTCPPISPVAWSTFMTGVNPGKHAIFDFLRRNPANYQVELSSTRIEATGRRKRAAFKLLRKSRPFWHVLGEHGVFSTVLRVPITYPPEKFRGLCLSGMCVPDLRGTQGTFSCFTTAPAAGAAPTGGEVQRIAFRNNRARAVLKGPPDAGRGGGAEFEAPFRIDFEDGGRAAEIRIGDERVRLRAGAYSDWVRVSFRAGAFRRIHGICRFYLAEPSPEFKLYVTPINIDPSRPAMPISHPDYYAIYLAKLHGPFATLGLAEDTWALSEGVIDDRAFLEQVYAIHDERERMFLDAIRRTRRGFCTCVFDASDRIQHMFMRDHGGKGGAGLAGRAAAEETINRMYARMDELAGRVAGQMGERDVLFIVSDHGFTSFRRGVNLNAWLRENGYLTAVEAGRSDSFLQSVDWDRTRAYTFGLSGVYLNRRGREGRGIVAEDAVDALKRELMERLRGLVDEATGATAIANVYDAAEIYRGPYSGDGPDVVVGFADGYRASWDAAVGRTDGPVFAANEKAWSGDHCVDHALVPGVFFCNREVSGARELHIADLAPTVLRLFGVTPPGYIDGRAIELMEGRSAGRS